MLNFVHRVSKTVELIILGLSSCEGGFNISGLIKHVDVLRPHLLNVELF